MRMQGYKTQLAVVLGSVFTLLASFGVGLSAEQQGAIVNFMAVAGWPALMWVMRYFTKGPIKSPLTGAERGTDVRTPWLVVLLVLLIFTGGCQTGDPQRDLLTDFAARTAVYQGVDEYVGADHGKAQRIQDVSATLVATLDGDAAATVAELQAIAEREIDWDALSPIDQANVRSLIELTVLYLQSYIEDGRLPGDYVVAVRKVLVWFHEAAALAAVDD